MRIKRIKWLTGIVEKLIDKHAVERRRSRPPKSSRAAMFSEAAVQYQDPRQSIRSVRL
jgi:hypothetical protein